MTNVPGEHVCDTCGKRITSFAVDSALNPVEMTEGDEPPQCFKGCGPTRAYTVAELAAERDALRSLLLSAAEAIYTYGEQAHKYLLDDIAEALGINPEEFAPIEDQR